MTKPLPNEFQPYMIFLRAATCIEPYNQTVALVLKHCFVDYVLESFDDTPPQQIINSLEKFRQKLPLFPLNGAHETKDFADDLFNSLTLLFRRGTISLQLPKQFWICGLLYSILNNSECEKRERICIEVAIRINILIKKAKSGKFKKKCLSNTRYERRCFIRSSFGFQERNQQYMSYFQSKGLVIQNAPFIQVTNIQKVNDLLVQASDQLQNGDRAAAQKLLQECLQNWK